jgi:glutathione synthase/RimK-type ligase-like ATP-grasp enzyme
MPEGAAPGSSVSPQPRRYPSVLLAVSFDGIGQTRLPELFHSAGFLVTLLCPQGLTVRASRHVNEWIPVPGGTPDAVASSILERFDEFAARFDWVLASDEPLLAAILRSGCADILASRFPFIPDSARLTVYLDKIRYLSQARDAGADVPEFVICRSRIEARSVAGRLGYPVIVRHSKSMAGSGVKLAGNEHELDDLVADGGEQPPFLVQRYVRGRVGCTTLLMDHGKPIRWFSLYKLFNWPKPFSPSGGGEIVSDPQVDRLIKILAPLHGFHGLCAIDWIQESATGHIFLLEFNPRYTPNIYQGARVGADFPSAFRDLAWGKAPAPKCGTCIGYTFAMFPEAAYRAIDDRNPWLLLRSLANAPYSDPRLLAAHFRRLARHYRLSNWISWLKRRW